MPYSNSFSEITLNENEQIVITCHGRIWLSLNNIIWILLFAPAYLFVPLLTLHHLFRPVCYIITTQRVLVVEPSSIIQSMDLNQIKKMSGSRTSLMLHSEENRMYLARLQDAWQFETIINKTRERTSRGPSSL